MVMDPLDPRVRYYLPQDERANPVRLTARFNVTSEGTEERGSYVAYDFPTSLKN